MVFKALIFAAIAILACPFFVAAAQQPPVADVPMLFRGTMPVVEVTVNGQGKFLFAIDTGAQGMARGFFACRAFRASTCRQN